ncbi:hypothetical protein PoB_005472400 [Plakobranchus ocellatus]|uniref:Uncharacterized protein n=1 Tax=Plakobranchus ocellatus TaxID=259542 RepID=A0AAV4C6M5_9GAST|nr:hypothetical protein PoB_005472400 [Plakobranchus ocellatus]
MYCAVSVVPYPHMYETSRQGTPWTVAALFFIHTRPLVELASVTAGVIPCPHPHETSHGGSLNAGAFLTLTRPLEGASWIDVDWRSSYPMHSRLLVVGAYYIPVSFSPCTGPFVVEAPRVVAALIPRFSCSFGLGITRLYIFSETTVISAAVLIIASPDTLPTSSLTVYAGTASWPWTFRSPVQIMDRSPPDAIS